ncbi:hydrogenase maturation protease [Sphaerisporangium sp. NPDC005289]|uniref:hydrogenase maturation protease n=1 Tax=Sphaerisporangium sp. NPDC005289 TaxID=3155247 RepID=UPI0033BF7146
MRTLVAGVGNVFLGDDGFGVAVARHLASAGVPEGVVVSDFGIRGVHLAYELTGGGYDLAILVDTVARDDPPGTLYVLRPVPEQVPGTFVDAHDMTPEAVLALAGTLGGDLVPVLLVGCRPADLSPGMELSPPVAGAVGRAADLVLEIVEDHGKETDGEATDHVDGRGGGRRHGVPVDSGPQAVHEDPSDVTRAPAGEVARDRPAGARTGSRTPTFQI